MFALREGEVGANEMIGGEADLHQPPGRNATHAARKYGVRGLYTREDGSFRKISGAVEVFGGAFGAQAGASRFVRVVYRFGGQHGHHWLYGVGDDFRYIPRIFASDS